MLGEPNQVIQLLLVRVPPNMTYQWLRVQQQHPPAPVNISAAKPNPILSTNPARKIRFSYWVELAPQSPRSGQIRVALTSDRLKILDSERISALINSIYGLVFGHVNRPSGSKIGLSWVVSMGHSGFWVGLHSRSFRVNLNHFLLGWPWGHYKGQKIH